VISPVIPLAPWMLHSKGVASEGAVNVTVSDSPPWTVPVSNPSSLEVKV
jgi:hypothetical protein